MLIAKPPRLSFASKLMSGDDVSAPPASRRKLSSTLPEVLIVATGGTMDKTYPRSTSGFLGLDILDTNTGELHIFLFLTPQQARKAL